MSPNRDDRNHRVSPLLKLAKKRKYEELETAWMSAIESQENSVADLMPVLEVLMRFEQPDVAETLVWCLVTSRAESAGAEAGLEAARQGAAMLQDSEMLRDEGMALYRSLAEPCPELEELGKLTLLSGDVPLLTAFERLDKYVRLRPGSYVYDRKARNPGKVVGFDPLEKTLLVAQRYGNRAYKPASIDDLEPLPCDDFRALVAFERERMETLAHEDPEELIRLTLKTFRSRLAFRPLKAKLSGLLSGTAWSTWWPKARLKIAQSTLINMSDDSEPTCVLRKQAIPYEVQLGAKFDRLRSVDEKLVFVLEYLEQMSDDSEATETFLQHLSKRLAAPETYAEVEDPGVLLGIQALLGRLGRELSRPPATLQVSLELDDTDEEALSALLSSQENDEIVKCILEHFKATRPKTWPEIHAALLPGCSREVCELIATELTEAGRGELIGGAAAVILKRGVVHLRALVWLFRAVFRPEYADCLQGIEKSQVTICLLRAGRSLMRLDADDQAVKRQLFLVRSAISSGNYARIRSVLKQADLETVNAIKSFVEHNSALTDGSNQAVLDIVRDTRPALFFVRKERWEEDAVYTTQDGLDRKCNELLRLTTEKLPAIALEIGKAAELGDLSENAEFTAALETRDRLAERATTLQGEIRKARLITDGMGAGEVVTVGSKVLVRKRASQKQEQFVFLGPWDAHPERGILSYRSPLGRAFMGAKVGDEVEVNLQTEKPVWEVLEIS